MVDEGSGLGGRRKKGRKKLEKKVSRRARSEREKIYSAQMEMRSVIS